MSEHSVLKFSLQMFVDRVSADDKFRWDKGDYSNLCKLSDINWDNILDVSNATVDEMWENFKEIVIDGMNLFIPRGNQRLKSCLLYTSPSPRDRTRSRMPSSA